MSGKRGRRESAPDTPARELRRRMGYTSTQLAAAVGVSEATYRNWEHWRTFPDLQQLAALAEFYKMKPSELLPLFCRVS